MGAFLDGNQPDRLCKPMADFVEERGGKVLKKQKLGEIVVNEDNSVKHITLADGTVVEADYYVSAMPVDVVKRYVPKQWSRMPFFRQLDELEGIPVINLHMWFDTKLKGIDHLCFSRSPLLSVYADMSTTCKEYEDPNKSMLELVFAPCSPIAGGSVNWIAKSDEDIIEATMGELARLFPLEIAADGSKAKLLKYSVVRTPRSVYAAIPGRNKYRPSQETPIDNFMLCGCYTSQKFLGSMEGATLAGKLAAEVVAAKAKGMETKGIKEVQEHIIQSAADFVPKDPVGVRGDAPISFGGGMEFNKQAEEVLSTSDPEQLVKLG